MDVPAGTCVQVNQGKGDMHNDIDWKSPPALRLGGLGMIFNPQGHVLLVEKSYKSGKERFGLPGGCAHPGEDAWSACIREIREELGIDVVPGQLLAAHWMKGTETSAPGQNFVFHCGVVDDNTAFILSDEITATHWVAPDDIPQYTARYTSLRIGGALEALSTNGPAPYLIDVPHP